MYKVATTNQGRFALINATGETIYLYHSEAAAITACEAMNRSAYEPNIDAYYAATAKPRWDTKAKKAA